MPDGSVEGNASRERVVGDVELSRGLMRWRGGRGRETMRHGEVFERKRRWAKQREKLFDCLC
jgi:hypothetical protein